MAQRNYFGSSYSKFTLALVFFVSFFYIFFFTQCVPFFFDDHQFHRDFVEQTYKAQISQIFSLNSGGLSDGPRPVFGILFKTLFSFLGFDYCGYRIVKSIIFSFFIICVYLIALFLFRNKNIAVILSFFIMSALPTFIQTFGYNGPHIIAEMFKILALLFFLSDFKKDKSCWKNQIIIFIFVLLAVRTYVPAFSVVGVIILFTLVYDRIKIKRYLFLFIALVLIQLPITSSFGIFSGNYGNYSPKLVNIERVLFNDLTQNIFNPIPNYSNLYYKSFTAILSFFGFWAVLLSGMVICAKFIFGRKLKNFFVQEKTQIELKFIYIFSIIWLLCELPSYIFLPEHAIRYLLPFLIAFSIFCAGLFFQASICLSQKYKKLFVYLILALIFLAVVINISYVYAFRAGWGSSFIAFDKTMDFFAQNHAGKNISVLYNSGSVAYEYFDINKSSYDYSFNSNIKYFKSSNLADFSKKNVANISNEFEEFYFLKRLTSVSKVAYPQVALEKYANLKEASVILGFNNDTLFDKFNELIVKSLNLSYEPNKIYVYKLVKIKSQLVNVSLGQKQSLNRKP